MENATQALMIAAAVLLGIMILTVGVVLFNTFSSFSADSQQKREEIQISEFNMQFIKYYSENKEEPVLVTAHDIVSLANLAKENNITYELQNELSYSDQKQYIQIDVDKQTNFEKKTRKEYSDFLMKNDIVTKEDNTTSTKYYICTDMKISTITKKVIYMQFLTYKN